MQGREKVGAKLLVEIFFPPECAEEECIVFVSPVALT